jgi:hypothetical protein
MVKEILLPFFGGIIVSKLLVLSLAETTSDAMTGYEVIARNLDNNSWVIIPT